MSIHSVHIRQFACALFISDYSLLTSLWLNLNSSPVCQMATLDLSIKWQHWTCVWNGNTGLFFQMATLDWTGFRLCSTLSKRSSIVCSTAAWGSAPSDILPRSTPARTRTGARHQHRGQGRSICPSKRPPCFSQAPVQCSSKRENFVGGFFHRGFKEAITYF